MKFKKRFHIQPDWTKAEVTRHKRKVHERYGVDLELVEFPDGFWLCEVKNE